MASATKLPANNVCQFQRHQYNAHSIWLHIQSIHAERDVLGRARSHLRRKPPHNVCGTEHNSRSPCPDPNGSWAAAHHNDQPFLHMLMISSLLNRLSQNCYGGRWHVAPNGYPHWPILGRVRARARGEEMR
jgi:hypothetical protein